MAEMNEIVIALDVLLSASSDLLTSDGKESAVNSALTELGWVLPQTDTAKIWWVTKRAWRHASYILWFASAQKFKYKQVNLQQRFDHYEKVIASMDTEFEEALRTSANIFAGVDVTKMFGTVIGAGFIYDCVGKDITYDDLLRFINVGV